MGTAVEGLGVGIRVKGGVGDVLGPTVGDELGTNVGVVDVGAWVGAGE